MNTNDNKKINFELVNETINKLFELCETMSKLNTLELFYIKQLNNYAKSNVCLRDILKGYEEHNGSIVDLVVERERE